MRISYLSWRIMYRTRSLKINISDVNATTLFHKAWRSWKISSENLQMNGKINYLSSVINSWKLSTRYANSISKKLRDLQEWMRNGNLAINSFSRLPAPPALPFWPYLKKFNQSTPKTPWNTQAANWNQQSRGLEIKHKFPTMRTQELRSMK